MITPAARALNKPMLIVGIDRKLAGLAFLLAVIVGANGSRIVAGILFLALCAIGRRLSRHDPNIFMVLNLVRRQKPLYDPMKREWFRVSLYRRGA
jgi:type IV secretory pathway TrbD component